MKKILYGAILIALISCAKDEMTPIDDIDYSFTAIIEDTDTKTLITIDGNGDARKGKVTWVEGDKILINGAEYVASSSGKSTKFTPVGTPAVKNEKAPYYNATYSDINNQVYTSNIGSNCPMEAQINDEASTVLSFTNTAAVVRINIQNLQEEDPISRITVAGYTLQIPTNTSYSDNSRSYDIAIPGGEYANFRIVFATKGGKICSKTSKQTFEIQDNHIRNINFSTLTFTIPELIQTFTINESDDKVKFARGNLWYDGTNYSIEDNQYDFRTLYKAGSVINGKPSTTKVGEKGLFTFNEQKAALTQMNYWEQITQAEWNYIVHERTDAGTIPYTPNAKTDCRWLLMTIKRADNSLMGGALIFADDFEWPSGVDLPDINRINKSGMYWSNKPCYTIDDFYKIEANGALFLPICGYADSNGNVQNEGSALSDADWGYYRTGQDNKGLAISYSYIYADKDWAANGYFIAYRPCKKVTTSAQ